MNAAPANWKVGGNTRVIQLPDGNKVFNLNGSGSAKLNLPMYQNADNFVVKSGLIQSVSGGSFATTASLPARKWLI